MKKEFRLKDGQVFIEMNKLLKLTNCVSSGGEAKIRTKSGEVLLNGNVEWQIRKKIKPGDVIAIGETQISIF